MLMSFLSNIWIALFHSELSGFRVAADAVGQKEPSHVCTVNQLSSDQTNQIGLSIPALAPGLSDFDTSDRFFSTLIWAGADSGYQSVYKEFSSHIGG